MPASRPKRNTKNRANPKMNAQNKSVGQVRIISGKFKGKKLPVQDSPGLRPTTDRVKETLFNWLMFNLNNARVLDCFAGSGSLGFEALSRYAKEVTLLEKSAAVARQLKQNLTQLLQSPVAEACQGQVIEGDCLLYLQNCDKQFDIIFIDPPFRLGLAEKSCQLIAQQKLLTDDGLIYVETEAELTTQFWPDNWQILKEKKAGQVCYRLFRLNACA